MSRVPPAPHPLVPDGEVFVRMDRSERLQHILVILSFTALAASGLPLLARPAPATAARLVAIHHASAAIFVVALAWHVLRALLTVRGRATLRERVPRGCDLRGPAGRYRFVDKLDYWGFLAGSAVMAVTGIVMVIPGPALELVSPAVFRAVVAVHGGEAVLAVVVVLTWHAYASHLRPGVFPMSRVWLDGRVTGAELRRDHPGEYAALVESRRASPDGTAGPEKSIIGRE
ncbi:MAG: cytochrome b/b6 domain-containing protein [Acidobacteria bacterium]|nr:cytochrome b/b6 domain-containing protein [Acidobacteriota bacterium]